MKKDQVLISKESDACTSCDCEDGLKKDKKPSEIKIEKADDQKLDPTHFGDWQVNCRTIDF